MAKIFISYRIDDSLSAAMLLYSFLLKKYGSESIFWDKKRIELGDVWLGTIDEGLSQSDFMLVLIGPRWLEILKERRKENRQV